MKKILFFRVNNKLKSSFTLNPRAPVSPKNKPVKSGPYVLKNGEGSCLFELDPVLRIVPSVKLYQEIERTLRLNHTN